MQETHDEVLNAGYSTGRLLVVDIRQRIEIIAVRSARESFPESDLLVQQSRIRQLLAFIPAAYGHKAPVHELRGAVRTARHIYKRSSDVLHGRSSMVNLHPVLIEEWMVFVEELEEMTRG